MPPFAPREALQAWQEKNHKWLELTDVHRETHSNVRITVMPFYMGTKVCNFFLTSVILYLSMESIYRRHVYQVSLNLCVFGHKNTVNE